MFSFTERTPLETEVEKADTKYGFTWVSIDGTYRIRTPDKQFKEVPKVVIDTLRERSSDTSIEKLIAETAEQDADAADKLREMHEEGFIRDGAPVERVLPPDDIRLWHRALLVAVLLCLGGVLWVDALSTLAQPILDHPYQYLLDSVPLAIPLILCSVVVHEFGHYYAAWKQGLDPSFGASVINGVIPAVVTRTHGGWCLPRNRRMWNTLAGPAFGLVWTLGVFGAYNTVFPHPGLGLAGVICFNLQLFAVIPLFHGDGYLLMTDFLGERNVRTRGLDDLRNGRPTWQAAYAALSYGVVIIEFAVSLIVGYVLGDFWGAGIALCLTVAIYLESWLGIVDRLRATVPPFRG
jgi:hypothetical protein